MHFSLWTALPMWGVLACCIHTSGADPFEFPGPQPGRAAASYENGLLTLGTDALRVSWRSGPQGLQLTRIDDRLAGEIAPPRSGEAFVVKLADGRTIKASELRAAAEPALTRVPPRAGAVRRAERFAGWEATVPLASQDGRFHVLWRAIVRDRANYVRLEVTIQPKSAELAIDTLSLLDIRAPGARQVGAVDGSPVVAGRCFFACEHPMARNRAADDRVTCSAVRYGSVPPDRPWTASAVIGVVPEGQLRRAFLYYLERERARPYQPFVYYISWFDIAAPDRKMNERLCLDRIEAFGEQLVRERDVRLDAFVFDDGWDDNRSLWQFHSGFPRGFAPLQVAAARYHAVLGTWISPWGGYGRAKKERLEFGKTQGFEMNRHGFSLAGSKYYQRFRSVCARHMEQYGVGYFKFDGVGPGNLSAGAGAEYGPDIEALLRLISDLRAQRPDLFVNTTVGTWPSPYWLWYSDSIWRSGRDVGFQGAGSTRQQWLTYRDAIGYQLRTRRGPLYPLNSLKFQSVMCAPLSLAGKISNDPRDVIDDIRMAAGSGTQLQEFFVTPSMFSPELWDAAAEAIGWIRSNADVLVDTHGIGGDPARGEVYGYASWTPRKGIVVLRNPTANAAGFALDVQSAFELPTNAPQQYRACSPWEQQDTRGPCVLQAGQPHNLRLAPFEVVTLDAIPIE